MSETSTAPSGTLVARRLYLSHGDLRPSFNKLIKIDATLETSALFDLHMLRSDVLTDCAVSKPEHSEIFLDAAARIRQKSTDSLLDLITQSETNQETHFFRAQQLAKCVFKDSLAEPWKQAVNGDTAELDYPLMLNAASRIMRLNRNDHNKYTLLAEFMPLILIARAQFETEQPSMVGRLALARETRRSYNDGRHGQFPNWNIGISLMPDANSFIEPDYRVHVNNSVTLPAKTQRYHDARVVVLTALRHGFECVDVVLNGCLVEQDISPVTESKRYNTRKLNRMTSAIMHDIQEQSHTIARLEALQQAGEEQFLQDPSQQ
jgi:hypothetical protein